MSRNTVRDSGNGSTRVPFRAFLVIGELAGVIFQLAAVGVPRQESDGWEAPLRRDRDLPNTAESQEGVLYQAWVLLVVLLLLLVPVSFVVWPDSGDISDTLTLSYHRMILGLLNESY